MHARLKAILPFSEQPWKTHKLGMIKSKFHAILTDHKVSIQKVACKCGWVGRSTIEGIYGSTMHPDLLKKQALQGSKESYKNPL